MNATVVFLGRADLPWLRIEDGVIVARDEHALDLQGPVVAVVPASRVTYRRFDMTALAPAQALGAARIEAADASLGAAEDRHVAVSTDLTEFVVTSREALMADLAALGVEGMAPYAVIPSPSLIPRPESGFVSADLPGESVLRGPDGGFAADDTVSSLIVGDMRVKTMTREDVEEAIIAATGNPPLNLLQGEFAPRIVWVAEEGYWRRMGKYALIALALTIAIPVVKWGKLVAATGSMDAETAQIAATALGEVEGTAQSIQTLNTRLADRRGGGKGYLATQAALTRVIEATPNVDVGSVEFDLGGAMRATVRGTSQADIDTVRNALILSGFTVDTVAPANVQGRQQAELTLRPQ